jgi:hypothetical protein
LAKRSWELVSGTYSGTPRGFSQWQQLISSILIPTEARIYTPR